MNSNKIKIGILQFLLLFSLGITAQNTLSNKATLSVITGGPGNELYTAFGHSAFRVFDPNTNIDKVYNYGTFDFNAPNFYLNFAKGKLTYMLSTGNYGYFLRVYNYEKRWVKEQVLNLNSEQIQKVYSFLENNATPENRSYQYDFFYENCATKIEEVLKKVLKDEVSFYNNHITPTKTHRDLISDYTLNNFKWGKFGIDLALGSVIDKTASKQDYKFLPDYIYKGFENATVLKNNKIEPLVKSSRTILSPKNNNTKSNSFTPFNIIALISIIIVFISFKYNNNRLRWLDFSLFLITGIIGIVVFLLWFATTHTATYNNFNFLWAFAPNAIIGFYFLKNDIPKWLINYIKLILALLFLIPILWLLKIQVFNLAIAPFTIALTVRYILLLKHNRLSTSKK